MKANTKHQMGPPAKVGLQRGTFHTLITKPYRSMSHHRSEKELRETFWAALQTVASGRVVGRLFPLFPLLSEGAGDLRGVLQTLASGGLQSQMEVLSLQRV